MQSESSFASFLALFKPITSFCTESSSIPVLCTELSKY
uniref:Uncharacterized protein n=1 Tax=Arundo donax TaxID=35708 RepID=A0A0A8ZC79_ARUDO